MRGDKNNFRYLSTSPTAVSLYTFNNAIPEAIRNSMEVAVDRYSANTPEQKTPDEITAIVDFVDVPEVIAKLYKLDLENWEQSARKLTLDEETIQRITSLAVSSHETSQARAFFNHLGVTPNGTLFKQFFNEPFAIHPLRVSLNPQVISAAKREIKGQPEQFLTARLKLTSDALASLEDRRSWSDGSGRASEYRRGISILKAELADRSRPQTTNNIFPVKRSPSSRKRKGIGR